MTEEVVPPSTPPPIEASPVAPPPAPVETPVVPVESVPVPESVQPAPIAPTPAPVAPTPLLVVAVSPIRQLLEKAKAKIQFRKSAKLEKIMVKAREQGSISNDEAQKLLRVSDATATRYLAELVKTGRLRPLKAVGRGACCGLTQ